MRTHRLSHTLAYTSWKHAMHRCYSKKNKRYRSYGGRGIKVCEFLRATPQNLIDLIGDRPSNRRLSLDRKDNDGNYSCGACAECLSNNWPLNVKWSTYSEQNFNNSHTRFITIGSVKKPMKQWAIDSGLDYQLVRSRVRAGWPNDRLIDAKTNGRELAINNRRPHKLELREVIEIRRLYLEGFKQREIAEMFSLNAGTVSKIITRKRRQYI